MQISRPERGKAATSDARRGLLRYYLALECASQEMLEAARAGDWDSVCRLEGACAVVIAQLRQQAQEQPLAPEDQPERMRILRSILANDAEIRRICQPLSPAMEGWLAPSPPPGTPLH